METISCLVVGEGYDAQNCVLHLMSQGFQIVAVFTTTEHVANLCVEKSIKVFSTDANNAANIQQAKSFDYLFNINYPRNLSQTVLSLARRLCIKYHGSPLPAYAGANSTSWAIIKDEKEYGVCWHVDGSELDTGDILQFQAVSITDEDSALSLNLKCSDACLEAFKRLVDDIVLGRLRPRKQEMSKRSYFHMNDVPPNLGVISFQTDIRTMYNLVRALDFGSHANHLGSPKICTPSGHFLLVINFEIASESGSKSMTYVAGSENQPSIITRAADGFLEITTQKGCILLSVAKLDGDGLHDKNLISYGLTPGARLPCVEGINIDTTKQIHKNEQFWLEKFKIYEPTMFFIQKLNVLSSILDHSETYPLTTMTTSMSKVTVPETDSSDEEWIIASFIAFLGRVCCTSEVHIGIFSSKDNIPAVYRTLYSDICPGVFHVDFSASIKDAVGALVKTLTVHKKGETFLLDMLYRYPELKERKRVPYHNLVVGLEADEFLESRYQQLLADSNILVLLSRREIKVMYEQKPKNVYSHVFDVIKHFPAFLKSMVEQLDISSMLLDISLISKEESVLLYNQPTIQTQDKSSNLLEVFISYCCHYPDNMAVTSSQLKLTYEQLLHEVSNLSLLIEKALLSNYKQDKKCMALHLPNSIAYVVSVLAAVTLECPFLPLPVDLPIDRVVYMLKDARVTVMVTTASVLGNSKLTDLRSAAAILFQENTVLGEFVMLKFQDSDIDNWQPQPQTGLSDVCSFSNLADLIASEEEDVSLDPDCCYIMYTSGSTGKPKGVQTTRRGVLNMAQAQVRAWDLGPHDVIAQYASIGFDATISEIFTAFLSGASLAVLDSTERLGKELVQTMITLEVTTVTLPPSLLNIYAPADFPTLKKVIAAGEACSLQTAIKWTSEPRVRFFNAYGPTETTVCATIYEFVSTAAKDNLSHDLPIGKAIDGVQVYLFDSFMRQVPPDVVGEIYIGGLGVSAGYIGHAVTKNKECFVTNPLNILLYKTGDYAIQGSDGNLTYVGRLDDQVKIRGQRVDLGEIEQVILQHSKVDMAVVVKYQGLATSDACIAAFVAPRLMRTSELREYLTKVLPKYMMPTCIKKMNAEDFPLTLNGKVDRRKLERDDDVCKRSARVFKSYLKPTELRVATLWCKVLQIDVDHANNLHSLSTFHELGGNSLHMVLLQKAIEKEFKVKISFTEISDICTIEKCVDAVRRKQGILKTQIASDTEDKEELKKLILQDSVLGDITTHVQDVRTTGVASFTTPKNIILTGATGFLGAFLLHEILEQSEAFVICMVRESSESRGLSRVVMNMEKYHLWKPEYKSRISVVFSDLSLPQLGIPDEKYKTLCRTVDTLYLNAAMMNFNTSYRDHRQTNVLAMKEFITFAFTGRKKFIFMTSSLAVFLFPPKAECHAQVEPLKKANPQSNATANGETADDHETRRFSCTNGFHFHLEAKEKNDMEVKTRIAGINDEMSRQAAVTAIKNCITLENCMKDGQTAKNVLDDETKNYEEEIKYTQLILNGAHATEATLANSGGPVAEVTQFQDVEATDSIISEYIMAKRVLFSEDDTIDNPTALSLGYCQSKWASEKLVLQALQQLPGGAVFRPARICGHSMTGVGPTNDLFAIMVTGMGKLGLIPDVDFPFDLIPVDFCAKGMVEIMLQIHRDEAKEMPQVYHFFNKSTVPFIEIFEDTTVQKLPLDQWREELESIAEDNPLLPLIPFFNSDFFDRSCDWPKFDTSNTDKYISQKCKQMLLSSREHLKICKQYFALNVPQVMNKQLNIHDKCFSN